MPLFDIDIPEEPKWKEQFDNYFNQPDMSLPVDALKDFISTLLEEVIDEIGEQGLYIENGETFEVNQSEFKQQLKDKYLK